MFLFVYFCTLAYFVVLLPKYWQHRHKRYAVLIAWGLLGSVYELGVGKFWLSKDAIRLDIFLLLFVTALSYAVIAGSYLFSALGQVGDKLVEGRQHGLLLVPQLLILLALVIYMVIDTRHTGQRIQSAQAHFIDACWRSPDTQKRCFGRLHSDGKGLTGYFRNEAEGATYRDLLINQDAGFTLISSSDYLTRGQLIAEMNGGYRLQMSPEAGIQYRLRLIDATSLALTIQYAQSNQVVHFKRQPLPGAKPDNSTNAAVKFVGVFSAVEKNDKDFWLTQVWIWRDQRSSWGYLFRNLQSYGGRSEFLTVSKWTETCQHDCDPQLVRFKSQFGDVHLRWLNEHAWQYQVTANAQSLNLQAGQYIPMLMLDQAPLDSRAHNQQWLADLTSLYQGEWRIPDRDQLQPF